MPNYFAVLTILLMIIMVMTRFQMLMTENSERL